MRTIWYHDGADWSKHNQEDVREWFSGEVDINSIKEILDQGRTAEIRFRDDSSLHYEIINGKYARPFKVE